MTENQPVILAVVKGPRQGWKHTGAMLESIISPEQGIPQIEGIPQTPISPETLALMKVSAVLLISYPNSHKANDRVTLFALQFTDGTIRDLGGNTLRVIEAEKPVH